MQFEFSSDGDLACLDDIEINENVVIAHADVRPALERYGPGSELAREAIDYAQSNELPGNLICPFARRETRRKPDAYTR
ncbi:hypothetical protein CRI94_04280 [Longibacter salinarum]|uniref:N-acetyltransferase domain-containing protein n=1 Tax=Longibacter salinarum TaxID=1850348 RepID=A0A2A8CZY3_9BACT|nr:hypothetical protein CRI94_04280 [Longibacter salinarum]